MSSEVLPVRSVSLTCSFSFSSSSSSSFSAGRRQRSDWPVGRLVSAGLSTRGPTVPAQKPISNGCGAQPPMKGAFEQRGNQKNEEQERHGKHKRRNNRAIATLHKRQGQKSTPEPMA